MGVVTAGLATGHHTTGGDYARFVGTSLARLASHANVTLPGTITVADVPALSAFVAQGRWVVDCPDCGLNRSMVWPGDPYMCPHCWNVAAGGEWRPVAMPEDADAIEAALLARPFPSDRNYAPGETVADLHAQTATMKGAE